MGAKPEATSLSKQSTSLQSTRKAAMPVLTGIRQPRDGLAIYRERLQLTKLSSAELAAALVVICKGLSSSGDVLIGLSGQTLQLCLDVDHNDDETEQIWKWLVDYIATTEKQHVVDIAPIAVVLDSPVTKVEDLAGSPIAAVVQDGDLIIYTDKAYLSEDLSSVVSEQVRQTLSHFTLHPSHSIRTPPIQYLSQNLLSHYSPPVPKSNHNCPLIFECIEKHAKERPNAIAVEWYPEIEVDTHPQILTYKTLDEKSNQLAHYLVSHGIKLGDKVAVCGARDLDFHVALVGIMKSGACYVPIEYELPIERKLFVVNNSNAKFVICPQEEAENFGSQAVVLSSPSLQRSLVSLPTSNPGVARVDSLAYLLYTSGTTGLPKGCLLNHEGLTRAIEDFTTFVPPDIVNPSSDKQLGLASIAFDVHLGEIYATWHVGARVVNAPRKFILQDLANAVIVMGVTHIALVPSLIEATLGPYWDDHGSGLPNLPLKVITSGGEKITDAILDRFTKHPSIRIINFYGPTEVTIGCTGRMMSYSDVKENIGKPFPSVRAFVVDESMNIVPKGVVGELVVEGSMVGVGYHGLDELSAKTFLEWPDKGSRAYKTGDLVRMMPDDTIHIIGRADSQIKLHGVRIESEGISNVLRKALSSSTSLLPPNSPVEVTTLLTTHPSASLSKEKLVSFVSWSRTSANERKASKSPSILPASRTRRLVLQLLEQSAERELAIYMRPAFVIPVDFLPLTTNNKADRRALEALYKSLDISILDELKDVESILPAEVSNWLKEAVGSASSASITTLPDLSGVRESYKTRTGCCIVETLDITSSQIKFLDEFGIDCLAKVVLSVLVRAYCGLGNSDVVCGEVTFTNGALKDSPLPYHINLSSAKTEHWGELLRKISSWEQEADEFRRSNSIKFDDIKKLVVGDRQPHDKAIFPAVIIRSPLDARSSIIQEPFPTVSTESPAIQELLRNLATSLALRPTWSRRCLNLSVMFDSYSISRQSATLFATQFLDLASMLMSEPLELGEDWSALPKKFNRDLLSIYEVKDDEEEEGLVTSYVRKHIDEGRGDSVAVEWFDSIPISRQDSSAAPNSTGLSESKHVAPFSLSATDKITYASLESLSNCLARHLVLVGRMKPEDRIAVCMPRNLAFHVAFLAIMKGGGCYVPIDPELPKERKEFIASDSDALFVFCCAPDEAHLFGDRAILLDPLCQNLLEDWRNQDDSPFDLADPDGLAYLLYTSGTTGTPKGCLCTHKGLSAAIRHLSSFWQDTIDVQQDRHLATSSIAFDVHILEFLAVFKHGYRICTAHRSELLEKIDRVIFGMAITHVNLIPSLIEAVIVPLGHQLPLKFIGSGGEKLSDTIVEWWASMPHLRLVNFYGPSEATIGCSARAFSIEDVRTNIGKTFPGCSAYVVDNHMNPVIRGAPGELVIEGVVVGRGYLKRPDLTSKVFQHWPGGRADSQIKLRGVRIESEGVSNVMRLNSPIPIEVSTVLASHPDIGVEQLVCFISRGSERSITEKRSQAPSLDHGLGHVIKALEVASSEKLAVYMRPSHIIPVTFLPLSSVGKINNNALVKVFHSMTLDGLASLRHRSASSPREPTPTELRLMQLISQNTTVPASRLHPSTHLFECGLDSLRLISLAAALRQRWKVINISVRDIMSSPTIEGIAKLVDNPNDKEIAAVSGQFNFGLFTQDVLDEVNSMFGQEEISAILPAFPVQEGVLYRSMGARDSALYVQHILLQCSPTASVDQIRRAWSLAMEKHEILRTTFMFTSKGLAQVLLKPEATHLPWSSHSIPGHDFVTWFEMQVADTISKEINRCMTMPVFRIGHYHTPEANYISLSFHHAIYDGISLPLLIKDVERCYRDDAPGTVLSMDAVLRHIHSIDIAQAEIFWSKKFEGFDFSATSTRSVEDRKSRRFVHRFQASLSVVESGASALRITLQALLLGAFSTIIGKDLHHTNDVAVGVIRSGRSSALDHIDSAVYPLVSVLPMRVKLVSQSGVDFLHSIQQDIVSSLSYEHVPLSKIQAWVNPGRPIFDIVFSYIVQDQLLAPDPKIWKIEENRPPPPEFGLAVEISCNNVDDTLVVTTVLTDPDISDATIQALLQSLETLSIGMINSQHMPTIVNNAKMGEHIGVGPPPPLQAEDPQDIDEVLEQKTRSLVGQFLGVEPSVIQPSYSLVSFGLDSLKAISLARLLRDNGYSLSAVELMKEPTLRAIVRPHNNDHVAQTRLIEATRIVHEEQERLLAAVSVDTARLTEDDGLEVLPVTGLQAGMLTQTIHSKGTLYSHMFTLRLRPTVDVRSLAQAWSTVLSLPMMSILRTSFHFDIESGKWAQLAHSRPYFDWTTEELPSPDELSQRIAAWASRCPLDSEEKFEKPPIRFRVFMMPETAPMLVIWVHHAVYDGVSFGKLLDIVAKVYRREPIVEGPSFTQIVGSILYEEKYGTDFWSEKLSGISSDHLMSSSGATTSTTRSWQVVHRMMTLDSKIIERTCRRFDLTPQSIGQAVWSKLLATLSHTLDVTFGQVVSGRSISNAEDVIGPVLNTIPCRVRMTPDMTNMTLLKSIHLNNTEALSWQHASVRSIQRALQLESLFDTLFLYQWSERPNQDGLWDIESLEDIDTHSQYLINIEFHQSPDGLAVGGSCNAGIMSLKEFELLLQRFEMILASTIKYPDLPISHDCPELKSTRNEDNGSAEPIQVTDGHQSLTSILPDRDEKLLREILAATAKVPLELITPKASLVALGIDSITAIQISAKCRKVGLRINAADFSACKNVGDVLQVLIRKQSGDDKKIIHRLSEQHDILPERIYSHLGLVQAVGMVSPGMEWLIGAWMKSGRSRFQHAFAFRGKDRRLDAQLLMKAWMNLVRRHSILRSTFLQLNSRPIEMVTFDESAWEPTWIERIVQNEAQVRAIVMEWVANPMSTSLPPVKAGFFRSADHDYFIVHLHHFQYDAWSLQLMLNDLSQLYKGDSLLSCNNPQPFLEFTVAARLEHRDDQEAYWTKHLNPSLLRATMLPKRHTDTASFGRTNYIRAHVIESTSKLLAHAQGHGVSLHSVLLAAWAKVQSGHTISKSHATFGLWTTGRRANVQDIERLAFPCMNVLPLQVPVLSGLEAARCVDEYLRGRSPVVEHSRLVDIAEWIGWGRQALVNIHVNIVPLPHTTEQDDGDESLSFEPVPIQYYIPPTPPPERHSTVKNPHIAELIMDDCFVEMGIDAESESIFFAIECDPSIFSWDEADDLSREWAKAIEAIFS
ncbi:Non-ribosomal peptide synthetase [Tulasnella sp. 418]|nr:Non-ribosomal peptide synthetase [Tulasnella sp. 418]